MDQVSVIGLACLVPGAQTPEEFWQNLIRGVDSTSSLTAEDLGWLDPALFWDARKPAVDKTYSLNGGFIRNVTFDSHGFHLPPQALEALDPLLQASLQVAKQALLDSHYLDHASVLAKCGVIFGNLAFPTRYSYQLFAPLYRHAVESGIQQLLASDSFQLAAVPENQAGQELTPALAPNPLFPEEISLKNALTFGMPSTLIAQALALGVTSVCLDAACSSSLYAIDLACKYLQTGKADLMLAGAISFADPLFNRMLFSGVQAYPDNGISRPLDQASRGLTPADGVVVMVLKRYQEAVRDGDRIYAVIRGVGLSNDGRDKHLLSPSQKGQMLAFERAYQKAQLSPSAIDYLECHATGTLLGDTTELRSIEHFFAAQGAVPRMGAVKANVGHALTAAGMVGVLKCILSMQQGVIPPTPGLKQPLASPKQLISGDRIIQEPTPWPQGNGVRRAAVNAFGFGGTNAHLILESAAPETEIPPELPETTDKGLPPLAIIGMDAVFGPCDGLDAFERTIYEGTQPLIPLPGDRWKGLDQDAQLLQQAGFPEAQAPVGAYISDLDIEPFRYKIPPNEVETLNPQQLLMLKVADRAIQDAALPEGGRVGVLVVMETDPSVHHLQQRWHLPWQIEQGLAQSNLALPAELLTQLGAIAQDALHPPARVSEFLGYVGNVVASRIAALWDFNGPVLTLNGGESSVAKALEVAQLLLSQGEADAVVVGAVDLAGNPEQVLLRQQVSPVNTDKPGMHLDQHGMGWIVGEGAGAVVLKRLDAVQDGGDRIYASVDAVSIMQGISGRSEAAIAHTCHQAHALAGIQATEIGYLEVFGGSQQPHHSAEVRGLLKGYQRVDKRLHCAIGSAEATIGHAGVASGMASLIKTALCLYHRYLPAVPQWSRPKDVEAWKNGPFHVATQSLPWFLEQGAAGRRAAISGMGGDETCTHLLLSEGPSGVPRSSRYLAMMPLCLFAIAAQDQHDLIDRLEALDRQIDSCHSLQTLAARAFATVQQQSHAPYTLVLLGQTGEDLKREIQRAREGIPQAFAGRSDWKTPAGSYFTANPQGRQGQVAFVYPGAFGAYVGIGRQSFRLFPDLYDDSIFATLGSGMSEIERRLYPRSVSKLTVRQIETLERSLMADPISMLLVEVGCARLMTVVLRDYFQLQPHCAFGYSLGETSMIAAQGIWQNVDQMLQAFRASSLFSDRLSGPQNALREYWKLPPGTAPNHPPIWSAHVLLAAVTEVQHAITREKQVYLTQINTPNEVVIAGDPGGCQRVIEALGCSAFRAPFSHLIHCPPMASEYSELAALHTLPVHHRPDITFYSAADYQPIGLDSDTLGHTIAKNLCQPYDFPRLVNRIYDDGVRIFLEVGAGNTCCRWISSILQGKDHVIESFDKRGMETHGGLLRMLAKLVSHQVAVDISPLYSPSSAPSEQRRSVTQTITLGGPSIAKTIASDRHSSLFREALISPSPHPGPNAPPVSGAEFAAAASGPSGAIATQSPLNERLWTHPIQVANTHVSFLKTRQESLQQMQAMIQSHIEVSRQLLEPSSSEPHPPSPLSRKP